MEGGKKSIKKSPIMRNIADGWQLICRTITTTLPRITHTLVPRKKCVEQNSHKWDSSIALVYIELAFLTVEKISWLSSYLLAPEDL